MPGRYINAVQDLSHATHHETMLIASNNSAAMPEVMVPESEVTTPSTSESLGSSPGCKSSELVSEQGFHCQRLRDDGDRFVHINKWFEDYDTNPCSKTEVIYLTCQFGDKPVIIV